MKITKKVQGHDIELELIKVKDYPRYTVYNVYKGDVFLYRTCFTSLQIKELVLKGFVMDEESTPTNDSLEEMLLCM